MTAPMTELPDAALKEKFDQIDLEKTGTLNLTKFDDRKRIRQALRDLGNTEEEIDLEVIQKNYFTFSDFKGMVKGHRVMSQIHDVPIVGVLTSAVHDNIADPLGDISDVELKATFERLDVNRNGTLDKTETAEGLRQLGKSEYQIDKVIGGMEEEEIDLDGFMNLLKSKPRPPVALVGGAVVPNPAKVHDIPIFGVLTKMAQDLLVGTGAMVTTAVTSLRGFSHEQLKEKFDEFDENGNGELDQREFARALRDLGKSEAEIKVLLERNQNEKINFTAFKYLARSTEGNLAVFGGSDMWTDKELKAKFDEIDVEGSGTMDLTNMEHRRKIRRAMIDLGFEEGQFDLESVPRNTFTFSDFKGLAKGRRQVSQLEDVPVVGVVTSAFATNLAASNISEVEMQATFERVDVDKSGLLDKHELEQALKEMEFSESRITKIVEAMEGEAVDLDGFRDLLEIKSHDITTKIGGVRMLNPAKIHDVPVIGAFTQLAQDAATGTAGYFYTDAGSEEAKLMKQKFDEFDSEGTGVLDKNDIVQVLRALGKLESEIIEITDVMPDDESATFRQFQAMVKMYTDRQRARQPGFVSNFFSSMRGLTSGMFAHTQAVENAVEEDDVLEPKDDEDPKDDDVPESKESSDTEEWDFENAAEAYELAHQEEEGGPKVPREEQGTDSFPVESLASVTGQRTEEEGLADPADREFEWQDSMQSERVQHDESV